MSEAEELSPELQRRMAHLALAGYTFRYDRMYTRWYAYHPNGYCVAYEVTLRRLIPATY